MKIAIPAQLLSVLVRVANCVNRSRLATVALVATALLVSAGFAWRPDPGDSPATQAAIDRFWQVYHGNDYNGIPQVEAQLEQALAQDPNNATLHALLGASHFWHIGEARTLVPQSAGPGARAGCAQRGDQFRPGAYAQLLHAPRPRFHQPGDHLPGYLGITTVHLGQMSDDAALIARGDQLLDFAAYQFPEFNNFNRWAAHNTESKDSASYQKALDSLWQGLDACAGAKVDRDNPDLKPYLNLLTSVGRKKACWWQGDLAPYSFEGYMLNLGNGLVKAGQVEAAKVIFHNAHYAANYDLAILYGVLEAIENSDLKARAALFA